MNKLRIDELSAADKELLYKVPAQITLLIAGADDNIDMNEIDWAEKAIHFRSLSGDKDLFDYYANVDAIFHELVNELIQFYPNSTEARIDTIKSDLNAANKVLDKLLLRYSEALIESWRSLAKHVAESSGGFLGFGSISHEEEVLMKLEMFK